VLAAVLEECGELEADKEGDTAYPAGYCERSWVDSRTSLVTLIT
jgi:hypothetical protein